MSKNIKNQNEILQKFGITELNEMQKAAHAAIHANPETVLLSPTGTGKTLAFLLPIVAELDPELEEVQALIIVPTRELAIQIENVAKQMGSGYKINSVYGGRNGTLDKLEIKHRPAILIGTPGRVADHLRRENFSPEYIQTLVLDEFDKSLEVGFEKEMNEILNFLPSLKKRILTSATHHVKIPEFVGLNKPVNVNFLKETASNLSLKIILSPEKDKLNTLFDVLKNIPNQPTIVFCSFKETIDRVSTFLTENHISHGTFFGGMEQVERERSLLKFRNGTYQILVATDLAARGIDIQEIKYIVHYHIPIKEKEFTHRNGRTARMHSNGTAYVLAWKNDPLPDYIQELKLDRIYPNQMETADNDNTTEWKTLYISGGRKDKISKGDIAGLLMKQGKLLKNEIGLIEIKHDCAFVAVNSQKAEQAIKNTTNSKLKTKKVRVSLI